MSRAQNTIYTSRVSPSLCALRRLRLRRLHWVHTHEHTPPPTHGPPHPPHTHIDPPNRPPARNALATPGLGVLEVFYLVVAAAAAAAVVAALAAAAGALAAAMVGALAAAMVFWKSA